MSLVPVLLLARELLHAVTLRQHAEVLTHARAVRVAVLLMIVAVGVAFVAAVVLGVVLLLHLPEGLPLPLYRLTIVEVQLHLPEVIQVEAQHGVLRLLPLLLVAILLRVVVLLVQAVAIQVVVLLPVLHRVAVVPAEAVEDKMWC